MSAYPISEMSSCCGICTTLHPLLLPKLHLNQTAVQWLQCGPMVTKYSICPLAIWQLTTLISLEARGGVVRVPWEWYFRVELANCVQQALIYQLRISQPRFPMAWQCGDHRQRNATALGSPQECWGVRQRGVLS